MKVIVQNRITEYRDEGQWPVILFLHGWQDSLRSFDAVVLKLISSGVRVVRLDLPGFGGTPAPKSAWELDDYVTFVNEFVRKLDLKVFALVGHSFGGRITLKGVAENILSANRIVLIGSAGFVKSKSLRNLAVQLLTKIGRVVTYLPPLVFWRSQIRKRLYRNIGSDYLAAGTLRDTFVKIIAEDLTQSARQIAVPTLLVWGAQDAATPLEDGQRFASLIQGSQLRVIDPASHFVHQEKPEEVAELILDFLNLD